MHISSLPSRYGIGTFGEEAYRFVDFLRKARQTYWQVLPLCPTGYGDSPYQSFSAFAGNPYFIDLDILWREGLLNKQDYDGYFWGADNGNVDYGTLYENRFRVLRTAFENFENNVPDDFQKFEDENSCWLEDYADYCAIKQKFGGKPWQQWDGPIKRRDAGALNEVKNELKREIFFYKFLQYEFSKQWNALKDYANERGIKIIGDIPIYAAMDSADVWAHPSLFINDDLHFTEVAGCPPDAFCEDGQVWGNPLYDWDAMASDGYSFWCDRLAHSSKLYDITRIDHFRGFDSFFGIPAGETTAKNGEWHKGPGISFFKTVEEKLGKLNIIAEDLGFLTDSVRKLLRESGFAGMKVLQFAFDSYDSDYLPHKYGKNCVVYTGTHDNDTVLGWFENASENERAFAERYMHIRKGDEKNWSMMACAAASVADTAIFMMQDILGLSSEARMNRPAVLGGNWTWRMKTAADDVLAEKLGIMTATYGRESK